MIYILIIVSILLLLSIYVNINLYKKTEKYEKIVTEQIEEIENSEKFIQQFSDNLTLINNQLTQLDERGTFEADDEVGFVFKTIKLITEQLQKFNVNINYAEEEKR